MPLIWVLIKIISHCESSVVRHITTENSLASCLWLQVAAHEDTVRDPNDTEFSPAGTWKQTLSAEEMQDQLEQFTSVMQQKFLSGEDSEHMDYSRIDNDEMLDDYWSKEANYDAEEKYFEED